jgi:kynurenine formamidase
LAKTRVAFCAARRKKSAARANSRDASYRLASSAATFPVHQLFLPRNGIYILENVITEELARDNVHEFAFVYAPLRLKGATGSPGNPIGIR